VQERLPARDTVRGVALAPESSRTGPILITINDSSPQASLTGDQRRTYRLKSMSQHPDGNAPRRPESGAFHTAMAHFFRGEIHRMTVWRTRLDTTSNWAILITTGLTTFTLGSPSVPHYTLLLGLALNSICMLLEGRRYQHLHHAEWRLRVLEEGYFAPWFEGGTVAPGFSSELAADLREPRGTIHLLAAVRLRLRRNYALLFYFITAVWLTKLFIHRGEDATTFYERLAVGDLIPSWFVAGSASLFVLVITALSAATPCREAIERDYRQEVEALESPQLELDPPGGAL
jgi:uncharacterized membrane protein